MQWYYIQGGERKGPAEESTIKDLLQQGKLTRSDLVWNEKMGSEWHPLSEFPLLSGPDPIATDLNQKAEMDRRIQEREEQEIKTRKKRKIIGVLALIVVALVGVFLSLYSKNAPYRKWGINSKHPMGTFEVLDKYLVNEVMMDKTATNAIEHLAKPRPTMYTYSNPKSPALGTHVGRFGTVTLMLDADNNLDGIMATFPSPGARGGAIVNDSVVSLMASEIWNLVTTNQFARMARTDTAKRERPPMVNIHGLVQVPSGWLDVQEKEPIRSLWLEYGLMREHSIVLFEPME